MDLWDGGGVGRGWVGGFGLGLCGLGLGTSADKIC